MSSKDQNDLVLKYEALLAAIPDIIVELDNNSKFVWANAAGLDFFGEDILGQEATFISGHLAESFQNRQQRKDGEKRLLVWRRMTGKSETRAALGTLYTARDITEDKGQETLSRNPAEASKDTGSTANDILPAYESKYKDLFENSPAMLANVDHDSGLIIDCNKAFCDLVGFTKDEIIGTHILERYHSRKEAEAAFKEFQSSGVTNKKELQLKKRDGGIIDVTLSVTTAHNKEGKKLYSRSVWQDISDRKKMEAALRESEQRFRMVFNQQFQFMAILSPQGHILEINDLPLQVQGGTREEYIGKLFWEVLTWEKSPEWQNKIKEQIRQASRQQESVITEDQFWGADGTVRTALAIYTPVRNSNNDLQYILAQATDITERKNAETALQKSEFSLREAQEIASLGNWEMDNQTGLITWSDEVYRIFGIEPRKPGIQYDEFMELVHPDDRASLNALREELSASPFATFEYRLIRPGGEIRWVAGKARTSFDESGAPIRMFGILQDITERKRAEIKISESEANLRSFINNTTDSIWSFDRDYNYLVFNQAYADTFVKEFGVNLEEGMNVKDYMKPEDQDFWILKADAALRGKKQLFEFSQEFDNGTGHFQTSFNPIYVDGEVCGVAAMSVDITHLKLIEQEIERNRKRYRTLFYQSPIALWEEDNSELLAYLQELKESGVTDLGDYFNKNPHSLKLCIQLIDILEINDAALNLFKSASREELVNILDKVFTQKTLETFRQVLIDIFEGKTEFSGESEIKTLSGETRYISIMRRMDLPDPGINRAMLAVVDITSSKLAELELQKSAKIINSTSDAVITTTLDGNITFWNHGAENIFGYNQSEAMGKPISMLFPEEELPVLDSNMQELGKGKNISEIEITQVDKNGNIVEILLSLMPLKDEQGTAFEVVGVAKDITKIKKLESQLHQSQKMEAIGQLASGVAHDFNNLLTVINGYCSMLLSGLKPEEKTYKDVHQIALAGERATSLTQQLLAFSRRQIVKPEIVDLRQSIRDTVKMLKRLIGEHVALKLNLDENANYIKIDAGQLNQIIMNIAVNARDAMPGGGSLMLETKNVEVAKNLKLGKELVKPGVYVCFSLTDTGLGMDTKTQQRIFEPFFTTKGLGRGTGLGLSTVYGIVAQNKGYISVYSEENQGTTFKIFLPQISPTSAEKAANGNPAKSYTGNEKILLVEDEYNVRMLGREILIGSGYEVVQATNGLHALNILEKNRDKFQLMVTDVIMPEIGGKELADKARKLCPDIKIIFMSGYSDDTIATFGLLDAGITFLQKPFAPIDLLYLVRDTLDKQD